MTNNSVTSYPSIQFSMDNSSNDEQTSPNDEQTSPMIEAVKKVFKTLQPENPRVKEGRANSPLHSPPFLETPYILGATPPPSPREQPSRVGLDLAIIDAITNENLETLQTLLNELPDINCPIEGSDGSVHSTLYWALLKQKTSICKYLIEEKGAQIDLQEHLDQGGLPAIVLALRPSPVTNRNIQLASYLLSHGAFLNEPFSYLGIKSPPLIYYAIRGDTKHLHILVESFGADVNVRDSEGRSPLHCVLKKIFFERNPEKIIELENTAKLLVDYNADIEEPDGNGDTLLMRFAQQGNLAVVELLASDLVADTLATNKLGHTAFVCALNAMQNPSLSAATISNLRKVCIYLLQQLTKEDLLIEICKQIHKRNVPAYITLLQLIQVPELIDAAQESFGSFVEMLVISGTSQNAAIQVSLEQLPPHTDDWKLLAKLFALYIAPSTRSNEVRLDLP